MCRKDTMISFIKSEGNRVGVIREVFLEEVIADKSNKMKE